jgi:glycosyltransferase involved in cell wall biosynthesis
MMIGNAIRGVLVSAKEFWRFISMEVPCGDTLKVFYGVDHLPGINEKVAGGIIKCQDLAREFPNNPDAANLLYLVSSSLPMQAMFIVKMAKKAGLKIVVNQNGVAYRGWYGEGWEHSNEVLKFIVEQADYVFYQSRFCKTAADRFLGPRKDAWELLHNPVDTGIFVPANELVDLSRGVKLLIAGSHVKFAWLKCAIETIAALRRLNTDVSLTIAGPHPWCGDEGVARSRIEKFSSDIGVADAVRLTGAYMQKEAVRLFQGHHILLHTRYNDVCPRLVVEAMSCGLPVVYSASGGVPELVGNDAGVGVDAPLDWETSHPPDPEKLAEGVQTVLENYVKFSKNARRRAVDRFDVRPWLQRHKEVFEMICQL